MNPKMTVKDAAAFLNIPEKQIVKFLKASNLPFSRAQSCYYFDNLAAQQVFKLKVEPKAIAFQIVKGGTGKTSLAHSVAVRANLYGLKVLCIDLDQQGNLTHTFDVDADLVPVMVDILAEGYPFEEAITEVYPGLDVLASRIENALLDDVIKLKKLPLDTVYRLPLQELKRRYDLIVIDCPPNLGQSVTAVTLGADQVVVPVVPENFALAGLKITHGAIQEIQENYQRTDISFSIVLNKYDARTILSQEALRMLQKHSSYKDHLLATICQSQEIPNAFAKGLSPFDVVKPNAAKADIDHLTRLLVVGREFTPEQKKFRAHSFRLEASLF